MFIRDLEPGDLGAAVRLLRDANAAPYDIGVVAAEKLFGGGAAGPPRPRAAISSGKLAGVAVSSGNFVRIMAVDPAERRAGTGRALLEDAEEWIRFRGADAVGIAAEPGNYFTPGIYRDDEGTRAFLTACGYVESGSASNLSVELVGNQLLDIPIDPGIRRAEPEELERTLDFVQRAFGIAWMTEAAAAFAPPGPPTIFIAEQNGRIVGFSAHDANNRGLGFFGPAGVADAARSRGVGRQLLVRSLLDLRDLGHGRAIVSWAAALGFYQKACGAKIAHEFVQYEKALR